MAQHFFGATSVEQCIISSGQFLTQIALQIIIEPRLLNYKRNVTFPALGTRTQERPSLEQRQDETEYSLSNIHKRGVSF